MTDSGNVTAEEFLQRLRALGRFDEIDGLLRTLGFTPEFVATNVLSGGGTVTVAHIAMLWQGMPNKHDRKRTRQLFDALADLGLLAPHGDDETWTRTSGPTAP